MAYKDSDQIANDSNYALGDYSFRIERSSVPGSSNDKVEAICTKGGKNARKSIQIPSSTKIEGWYVEANETEASVYISVEGEKKAICWGPTASAGTVFATGNYRDDQRYWTCTRADKPVLAGVILRTNGNWQSPVLVGASDSNVSGTGFWFGTTNGLEAPARARINDVDFVILGGGAVHPSDGAISGAYLGTYTDYSSALQELVNHYFKFESGDAESVLVGRFAIDIEDAGGDGPGSDWEDPGDYDPDWEEGDPTHTLYVTVTGALSGRHNDPIVDSSYSYIPSDKDTVKQYGCGGDGGHGGGGGAGASTVVIHKFATNQANSKEVTAIARRHGYGSGGGKGGKGGDGCILVYY